MFGFRRVREEFEARLRPPAGASRHVNCYGKLERTQYGNGDVRLKLSVGGFDKSASLRLQCVVGSKLLCYCAVTNGRGRTRVDNGNDGNVVALQVGDRVRVLDGDDEILSGDIYLD